MGLRSATRRFNLFRKGQFKEMKTPEWYSGQVVLAWRASLAIPSNWMMLMPHESFKKHPVPNGTIDIAEVVCHKNHWRLLHFPRQALSESLQYFPWEDSWITRLDYGIISLYRHS